MDACSARVGLEPLEIRLLLSATSADDPAPLQSPVAAVEVDIEPGLRTQTITWQGESIDAAADRWVLRYDPRKLNVKMLERRLKKMRIQGASVTVLGQKGFALLEASFEQAKKIERFARVYGAVKYVEPDAIMQVDLTPNDTSFGTLWGLHNIGQSGGTFDADIDAPEAWNITTGSSDVVIAVIDSGIDYNHPDLAANIWINPGEIAGNGIDDDGNGFVDDVRGWNFDSNNNNPMDQADHGTHVAGTIGAVGNNNRGVVGVNWNVKLMALRFLDANGNGSTSDAVAAVNYATMMKRDHGINVVATNNSWGGGGFSLSLRDAIAAAAAQDILFIAAAGNGGADKVGDNNDITPHYPSNYALDNVIAVAATDRNDNLANFSNYGANTVHLAAPGVSILSTTPGNSYSSFSGTSMATPHVAGVVGLLAAAFPDATGAEIKAAILAGVDPIVALANKTITGGRLNALGALQAFIPPPPPSELGGFLWHDLNADGTRTGNEPLLAGRTVFLDMDNDGVLDQGTSTFANTTDFPISSGSPPVVVNSPIVVSGLSGYISKITVTIDINHTWDGDLSGYLISPLGTAIELFHRIGGSGNDFDDTTFDDDAATSINAGSPPFDGTFRPNQPLSTLNGETANGQWTLQIHDQAFLDGGDLLGWSITIDAAEPSQVTGAGGAYIFEDLEPGPYRVRQVLPEDWIHTWPTPASLTHNLLEGQSITDARIGSYQLHDPIADAGGPYAIQLGDDLVLDGSASGDVDAVVGDAIVSYAWDLNGDSVTDVTGVNPTVTAATLAALGLAAADDYTVKLRVTDSYGKFDEDTVALTVTEPTVNASVVGRYLFYNNSKWDAAAQGFDDNDAIAPDKEAYIAGQGLATFANYSSYSHGINGIMVDIADLPGNVTADDFIFRVGNTQSPASWSLYAGTLTVTVHADAGVNGSTRVKIIFPDGSIAKQWLQVTVKANANTGLVEDDVFYFGNAVGETGNVVGRTEVSVADLGLIRSNPVTFPASVPIDHPLDINRDGRVTVVDSGLVRSNPTNFTNSLLLLDL